MSDAAGQARSFIDRYVGQAPRIGVREWEGDGRAFVLMHGLGHNLEVWSPLVAVLPTDAHVVAVDLRGHGLSDTGATHRYEDDVTDVLKVVRACSVERPILIGHSWGARVALYAAAVAADQFAAVVALDQALWDYEPPERYLTAVVTELEPLPSPVLNDKEADAIRAEAPRWGVWRSVLDRQLCRAEGGWIQKPTANEIRSVTVSEAQSQPTEHLYARIACPVAMLFASDDGDFGFAPPIGRRANVAHLQQVAPLARIEWIQGDHNFHVERPEVVVEVLTTF